MGGMSTMSIKELTEKEEGLLENLIADWGYGSYDPDSEDPEERELFEIIAQSKEVFAAEATKKFSINETKLGWIVIEDLSNCLNSEEGGKLQAFVPYGTGGYNKGQDLTEDVSDEILDQLFTEFKNSVNPNISLDEVKKSKYEFWAHFKVYKIWEYLMWWARYHADICSGDF